MEGTGFAGGLALILARRAVPHPLRGLERRRGRALRRPDRAAAAPDRGAVRAGAVPRHRPGSSAGRPTSWAARSRWARPAASPRPGWPPSGPGDGDARAARERFGIPADALVFGIVGSLAWNRHAGYCYGLELVRAIRRVDRARRPCARGRRRLRPLAARAGGAATTSASGSCPPGRGAARRGAGRARRDGRREPPPDASTASAPSATRRSSASTWRPAGRSSRRGSRRHTTWTAAGCGDSRATKPWEDPYVQALAELMEGVSAEEIAERCERMPAPGEPFDGEAQRRRVTAFIRDVASQGRPAQ